MKIKKEVIIATVITSLILYKIITFKVGPCSPEREMLLSNR